MTNRSFVAGDIVRVLKSDAGDGTTKLTGMIFPILHGGTFRPALDVTAAHYRVTGFAAWPDGEGKYGWYVDEDELELVVPSPSRPVYTIEPQDVTRGVKVASVKPKRDRDVPSKPLAKSSLTPQCQKLLTLLETKGSVTTLEAPGVYRIRSLPRRISDLKEAGYSIVSHLDKDVTGQRYARYYLKGTDTLAAAA